jgi:hypothetical protein
MKDDQDEESFASTIDQWVLDLTERGITDFGVLLRSLPGVYPTQVLESISRIADIKKIPGSILQTINLTPASDATELEPADESIVAHPLDYEWRFASSSVASLFDQALTLTKNGDTILLLGTPSLSKYAAKQSIDRKIVLIEKTPQSSSIQQAPALVTVRKDLLKDNLPRIQANVVVADPPWYVEYLRAFLWYSARCCKVGGYVLMSFPPVGTRPKVHHERKEILSFAGNLGLELVTLSANVIRYRTPFFELNSLRALGIQNVPYNWRSADLVLFRHARTVTVPRPKSLRQDEWLEEEIEGVRIRVRSHSLSGFSDPRLISVVPHDILTSVSRRDNRRSLADVWTSGNRIFGCTGTNVLLLIMRSLLGAQNPTRYVSDQIRRSLIVDEIEMIECACLQLEKVIKQERGEQSSYLESTEVAD